MKLTVEFSTTELQKMLQAIAGSEEHSGELLFKNGRLQFSDGHKTTFLGL